MIPLVFIHGIKGSVLIDSVGSQRWLTISQALGLSAPDLRLPLCWNGDVQKSDGTTSTRPLESVAWHAVYAPFLQWAAASGRRFHAFSYDWRRDNLETAESFIRALEKISAENGNRRIQVAAHSLGGLISFVALNRRPELFHSVLFAGVPFGSSISFLEDLHAGTSNGFNSRILSPQVYFSFASPYVFFPTNPMESRLVDTSGNLIEHNWYSAEDWSRQKLGIFSCPPTGGISEEHRTHLRKALKRGRELRSEIAASNSVQYPPIAVLAGQTLPTVTTVVHNGPHSVRGWDFVSARREPGDNRVASAAALPPPGIPYTLFKSSRAHDELLNDTAQAQSILEKLLAVGSGSI